MSTLEQPEGREQVAALNRNGYDEIGPQNAIDQKRVKKAAEKLELPIEDIESRYEEWARRSHGLIRIAWQDEGTV